MQNRRVLAAIAVVAALSTGAAPGAIDVTVEVPGADTPVHQPAPGTDVPGGAPEPWQPAPDDPLPRTGAPTTRLGLFALTLVAVGTAVLRANPYRPDRGAPS